VHGDKKIQIVHFIGGLKRGGTGIFLLNLIESSRSLNAQFTLVCYGHETFELEQEFLQLGASIVRTNTGRSFFSFFRIIKKLRANVVHAHTGLNSGIVMIISLFAGVNLRVVHSHSTSSFQNSISFSRKLYEILSFIGARFFSNLRLACGVEAGKYLFGTRDFTVIPNGINTKEFQFTRRSRDEVRNEIARKVSIPNSFVLGIVGKLEDVKNISFSINIMKRLLKKIPNAVLVIVGTGELEQKLREKAKSANVDRNVIFLGARNDIGRLLNSFDVLLLPSKSEGFPIVAVEAQVNGLPILMSSNISSEVCLNSNCLSLEISPAGVEEKWVDKLVEISSSGPERLSPGPWVKNFDKELMGENILQSYIRVRPRLLDKI
jgi:glycosyltransferase involved in cell wall biosynthesis